MSSSDPRQTPPSTPVTRPVIGVFNLGLIALLISTVVACLLGAALSGLIVGNGWAWPPAHDLPYTLWHWAIDPVDPAAAWRHDPRPGPAALTYASAVVVLMAEGTLWAIVLSWRNRVRQRSADKRSGLAQPAALDERLSQKAVAKTASRLRPLLSVSEQADPDQVGARFAVQRGSKSPLFGTHEDSKLVVAPARSGKTNRQAVPDVLLAPGAVVATSTRFDLLELTAMDRAQVGRVMVFDPEGRTPWPTRLRWSFIVGCDDYDTALRRAIAICSARPLDDTKNSGYFGGHAEGCLAALLHAAALSQSGVDELRMWVNMRSRKPADILDADQRAALGVAAELRGIIDSAASAHDTAGARAIYSTLALLLRPLASPATRDACTPRAGDDQLDIDHFVRSGCDTLYLISRGREHSAAPIVNALMVEILHRADILSQFPTEQQLAAPSYGDLRLDPPIRIVMDEAANVSPVKDLAMRLADSGGRGVQLYVFVQSLSQLRQRWGPEQAIEIWDNATVKLILGGLANSRDLEEISRLLPERAIDQASVSTGLDRSQITVSQRWQSALRANEVRELPEGEALLFYRNLPGAVVELPGWWENPVFAERVAHSRWRTRQLVAASGGQMPPGVEHDDDPELPGPRHA